MQPERPKPPSEILYRNELLLRPFTPEDASLVEKAVEASRPQLQKFMHWVHFLPSKKQLGKLYAQFEEEYWAGRSYSYIGISPETSECILCCGLRPDSHQNPLSMEIGYWVNTQYKNQGLGTLATRVLIALGFEWFHADRLALKVSPENPGSRRIVEKCGFLLEGSMRNGLFPGTAQMIENGYSKERSCLLYSLIPEDLPSLSWYRETASSIQVFPKTGAPIPLKK